MLISKCYQTAQLRDKHNVARYCKHNPNKTRARQGKGLRKSGGDQALRSGVEPSIALSCQVTTVVRSNPCMQPISTPTTHPACTQAHPLSCPRFACQGSHVPLKLKSLTR